MATKEQKALAVKRLKEIGSSGSAYIPRAKKLIETPALVNQDDFGICGMAASTHILLAYDPVRFVDLLRAVFCNEPFEGIDVGLKAPGTGALIEHRLEQFERKMKALPPKSKVDTDKLLKKEEDYRHDGSITFSEDHKLDFLVCRSLGKLLKKVDKPLYEGAKDLSKKFAPGMKVAPDDILKAGDLALTGEAVEFILREIVQVPSLAAHDQKELTSWGVISKTINEWFANNAGREPLIVAAVNHGVYSALDKFNKHIESFAWLKGIAPPDGVFRDRLGKPDFDHWVLFTGPVKSRVDRNWGAVYEIPVWSWGERFTAVLKQNNTQQCIAYLICASLDPQKTSMPLIVPRTSPDWVADATTHNCTQCKTEIGKGSRHHCRICGKLFCGKCCPELEMVPGRQLLPGAMQKVGEKISPIAGPVRVCSRCFREHAGFDWMRDNDATKCQVCKKPFGAFRWRHHCRYCGKLVCSDCSEKKKANPGMGYVDPVRICDTCFKAGK